MTALMANADTKKIVFHILFHRKLAGTAKPIKLFVLYTIDIWVWDQKLYMSWEFSPFISWYLYLDVLRYRTCCIRPPYSKASNYLVAYSLLAIAATRWHHHIDGFPGVYHSLLQFLLVSVGFSLQYPLQEVKCILSWIKVCWLTSTFPL